MSTVDPAAVSEPAYAQLVQATATIEDAAELFASNDPAAPMPIVVVPRYQNRIANPLMLASGLALVGALLARLYLEIVWLPWVLLAAALVLLLVGLQWAFVVIIPEGMQALLARGGRYTRTVGAGYHTLPPWIMVSHLVTARAIPYAVIVRDAPTADLVRADVEGMVTFRIEDPALFVFKTSTGAFDEILQASCRDALRRLVRRRPAAEINDINEPEREGMRERISNDVSGFGVQIATINITQARLPESFMLSQEARQLAIVQQAEQAEQQALALRRQADAAIIARNQAIAAIEQLREALRSQTLEADVRRQVAEADAETLARYPQAVQMALLRARIEVARALAANGRTILRVGGIEEMEQLLHLEDLPANGALPSSDGSSVALLTK
jgi:regulator of protease activity HflC (stomatin/prohibitin superfamily)